MFFFLRFLEIMKNGLAVVTHSILKKIINYRNSVSMSKFAVVFSSFKFHKQREIPINHTGKTAR